MPAEWKCHSYKVNSVSMHRRKVAKAEKYWTIKWVRERRREGANEKVQKKRKLFDLCSGEVAQNYTRSWNPFDTFAFKDGK